MPGQRAVPDVLPSVALQSLPANRWYPPRRIQWRRLDMLPHTLDSLTEITFKGFFGVGIVEDGAVGTGDGAQFAPHAHVLPDHFGADRRDGDRLHGAGHQAPGFRALRAGIG